MKKTFIFSAFVMGLAGIVPNVAHANKQSCEIRETDTCDNDNEYLSIDGVRGCYVCEKKKCVTGDLVVATNARLNKKSYRNHKFRCQLGWDDEWIAEPIPDCSKKWQKVKNDDHASQKIINPDTGEPMFNDNSSQVITGADPCMAWICDRGYTEVNGKCVDESAQQRQEQQQQQRQQQAAAATKKASCEKSGGIWSGNKCNCDASKNLRTENNVCVCPDNENYKRVGDHCELTDIAALQRKCEAAGADIAYWENNRCECMDATKIWRGTTCIPNPDIEKCEKVSGAEWSNGECKCKDTDKELNEAGTACVETDEARQHREDTVQAEKLRLSTLRINDASSTLKNLKEGLSLSVWKNKDGKFNTSRLASDSIAAVVLGTAGGLITSNVIKKNQIKNGFEDISCTVGGQMVAGWGDEFRVGIQ